MTHGARGSAPSPIQFEHVWKQYRMGANHDSLRDAIPAFFKRCLGRNGHAEHAGDFWAVKDVSFEVRQGETLGIIGPNGAGKSTILKLLSRITTPTKGQIAVRGRLAALIELGGGFHPDLSGAENVYLQGTMLGLSRRQISKLFNSIVAFSELEAFLQTPVKRYSSGMVVRLGFAIAAHVRPDVLLLDEVLAVGDLGFQQKCFKRIAELKDLGTTMIFISHNLEAVQKLCDRVLLLRGGQIVSEEDPVEAIRLYREAVFAKTLKETENGHNAGAGHADVQVTQVTVRNATGTPMEAVEVGQPLFVDVGLRAGRRLQQPIVRISLERIDGLVCHVASTHDQGLLAETLSGEVIVTLEYPAMSFLPNLYQLVVEVFEDKNPIPVATGGQGAFFQVTSEQAEQGTVRVEHRWSLSDVPPLPRSGEGIGAAR